MQQNCSKAAFSFPSDWWTRIEPTLPAGVKPNAARLILERRFDQFLNRPDDPGAAAKRARKVAGYLDKAMEASGPELGGVGEALSKEKADVLHKAEELRIATMPTHYDNGRTQATRWPNREQLFRDVMAFWTFHGGVLKSAWDDYAGNAGLPSGPAVRFLVAVLSSTA